MRGGGFLHSFFHGGHLEDFFSGLVRNADVVASDRRVLQKSIVLTPSLSITFVLFFFSPFCVSVLGWAYARHQAFCQITR